MKPWMTSSAMTEPCKGRPSFRLDPQWSGYGPNITAGHVVKAGNWP